MEQCFRCERTEKEVKLVDAIYGIDMVKVCEKCAVTESIPVVRKPSASQLKESEMSGGVYQRLKKMSGLDEKPEKHESLLEQIRKIDEEPELELPSEKPLKLIDNFHWAVMMKRRKSGLSQKQLATALRESETAIKMVERGELPDQPEKLIRKLEQFLQIVLIERPIEEIEEEKRKREEQRRLAEMEREGEPIKPIIKEDTNEIDISKATIPEEKKVLEPSKVLNFKPEVMKDITINDLKRIREEQEREDLLRATEEQRKTNIVNEVEAKNLNFKRRQELKSMVAGEMKHLALDSEKPEHISEKREMLNVALERINMIEQASLDKTKKEGYVPTIAELLEKRRDKERVKIEREKIELKKLEKKSEQEQIKQILSEDWSNKIKS